MSSLRPRILFVLLLILCGAGSVPAQAQRSQARRLPVAQPTLPASPATPSAPLTLEQMPITPPQVSFHNGQLTIVAQNSTLGDILLAVRNRTGAALDVPPNANERVVSHLGPGPAREVLASLLNGSHFNYVMLGSPADPTGLDRVILMAKSGGSGETTSVAQAVNPQPSPQPAAEAQADDDLIMGDDVGLDETDTDTQADGGVDLTADPSQPAQQTPKTPEQLLQELQRQQQGLQQQQPQPGAPQGFPMPGMPMPRPQPQPQPPQ